MPTNSPARPDSPSRPDLEGLKSICERGTPVPWEAQEPDTTDVFVPIIGLRLGDDGQPMFTPTNGLVGGAMLFPIEIDAVDFTRALDNAAKMTAAVNALPSLIAHVERLEAIVGEMLDKFDTIDGQPFINPPDNIWARARAALSQGTSHE